MSQAYTVIVHEELTHAISITVSDEQRTQMRSEGIDVDNPQSVQEWLRDNLDSDDPDILEQIGDDTVQSVTEREVLEVAPCHGDEGTHRPSPPPGGEDSR